MRLVNPLYGLARKPVPTDDRQPDPFMSEEDFRREIRIYIMDNFQNHSEACKAWGLSRTILSKFLNGKIQVSPKIMEAMGYEHRAIMFYRKKKPQPNQHAIRKL
jgi:hypothetical protein